MSTPEAETASAPSNTNPVVGDYSVTDTDATVGSVINASANKNDYKIEIASKDEDVSVADSDSAIAGSSVAATEADEDAASYAIGSIPTASTAKLILTKDSSLELSISKDELGGEENEEEVDAAPMHLHVLRTPARLRGTPGAARSRSSSRSRPGSRRSSISPSRSSFTGELGVIGGPTSPIGGGGAALSDALSVLSSLDGLGDPQGDQHVVDPDILLDKLGFRDLDPNASQAELREMLGRHLSSNSCLPTLNERMSEDTMEDVRAFQDLVFVKKSSEGSAGKKKVAGESVVAYNSSSNSNQALGREETDGSADTEENTNFDPKALLLATHSSGIGTSSSAMIGSQSYLLNTLDEALEEEEDEDEEEDDKAAVILEIPDAKRDSLALSSSKRNAKSNQLTLNTTAALPKALAVDDFEEGEEDEEADDLDDRQISPASSLSGDDERVVSESNIIGGKESEVVEFLKYPLTTVEDRNNCDVISSTVALADV